jgi:hypothetical protein
MNCEQVQIQDLETKQPIFKEYCEINCLKNGDFYKPKDFIIFSDSLSYSDIVRIIKKWSDNNAE